MTQACGDPQRPEQGWMLPVAHRIADRLSDGTLGIAELKACIAQIRDECLEDRTARLRRYVGLQHTADPADALRRAAEQLVTRADDPAQLATMLARPAFSAVFTAHPTFALDNRVYELLAGRASDPAVEIPKLATHRRSAPPTLMEELSLAMSAIARGRDALDALAEAILAAAIARWPDRADEIRAGLRPSPVILASWVGFDTDGRTDIGWWDTLRIRLMMKAAQLTRLRAQTAAILPETAALIATLDRALDVIARQTEACPDARSGQCRPEDVAAFARLLIGERDDAILGASALDDAFADTHALVAHDPQRADALSTAIAGFKAHGLSLARVHTRLNAGQIYNVARARLGIEDDPGNRSHRRVVLSQINEALDNVTALPVDFGALLVEQSSAARLMMTMAQIVKHIDAETPVRFLIAETESGYTLLATLWLARLLGIPDHLIEISPLFETRDALEDGETIIEEALRSRHWRDYLARSGRLCLQFGYSDSGRYVGQLAATNLVERLRLRTAALLREHELTHVEVVLFDTHGESIGRGAHPFHLSDRLKYLSPSRARLTFAAAGIVTREESAFQGGDGYTLFGTDAIAKSTIATLAEHVASAPRPGADPATRLDQVYEKPDFASDFFSTIALDMGNLVEDPGYGALLGAFGPSLIDKTGSRPSARQSDSAAIVRISHPSQLRAIPNNAILQQLGWWADVVHGLGSAAARHPDAFEQFMSESPRFRRALDFARAALSHSDIEVLRTNVLLLDPGTWLDRAGHAGDAARRRRCVSIAHGLEALGFWTKLPMMFRRIQADHLALRGAWPDSPRMATREHLLHAIRIGVIEQIWQIATRIPYFSPRADISYDRLLGMILCLDVPQAMRKLNEIFPRGSTVRADLDFAEPSGPRDDHGFVREHEQIFTPISQLFDVLREISIAIMHANGAFG
ncbi:phosphoenolpyruvate carboxylase [Tanticharoenia sakaeratensis]|uniref:Phosphoenolpyruvate carboxylase n=1 Tax=Tanticharoenia sakaeratensis NBRC 103193 TaxID=1231623 RepID=A0A0D6MNP5_9PROT|nr:phosphoenolpyruvate carboxylase [Tanticharoenia sakaeratensis NBRC 103193]GBQ20132.1 phosphoenolpyruvate carboxylase [Tanticharoenia sakaeratensis NBRC 103193]